jgi:hypothetical protein
MGKGRSGKPNHYCGLSVGGTTKSSHSVRPAVSPSPAPALLAVRYHEKWGAATYENGSAARQKTTFQFLVYDLDVTRQPVRSTRRYVQRSWIREAVAPEMKTGGIFILPAFTLSPSTLG